MDLIKRIKDISEEDVNRQLQLIAKILQEGKKGRETLDALRKLFQFMVLRDVHQLPSALLQLLVSQVQDESTPSKLRALSALILHELISTIDLAFLKKNMRSEPRGKLLYILPLLLATEEAFANNFDNLHFWLTGGAYQLKDVCFPALLHTCRKYPHLVTNRHIRVLEAQCTTWLSAASRVSGKDANAVSFLNLTSSKPVPVTELDGSTIRDFYTLMNVTAHFTEDQVYNIHSVSVLHGWLYYVHLRELQRPQRALTMEPDDPEAKKSPMDENLKKNSVAYCLRVIDQAKAVLDRSPTTGSKDNSDMASVYALPSFEILAVIEAVRTIDMLCRLDRGIVPTVFGTFKKLSANVNRALTPTPGAEHASSPLDLSARGTLAQLVITLLVFFIHHGETMVYDVDPIFRAFLETYIGTHFDDPLIAFEVLVFCATHKLSLLHNTGVLTTYFPPLFKLFAYHPQYIREMKALLPSLIGPSTCLELLHTILDLPLLTAALIRWKREEKDTRGDSTPRGDGAEDDPYRALYNYLLRNESGVTINWWSYSTTRPLIDMFCQETIVTPHIEEVMSVVPSLLDVYFDTLITWADASCLSELLPIIFERVEQLFPFAPYEEAIRDVIVAKLLAIFHQYPEFVAKHHGLLISEITRNSATRKRIVLHLCHVIGEYATPNTCDSNLLNDYDETLQLLAFELMTSVQDHEDKEYAHEFMSVLVSSLTKMAARWPPLSTRVELCLHKLDRYKAHFHESVIHRAYECLNLLKFPSIAAAILGQGQPKHPRGHHIDDASSIPFQLLPAGHVTHVSLSDASVPTSMTPLHRFEI